MTSSAGHMVSTYVVYCATCCAVICIESSPEMRVTKPEAIEFARGEGWITTRLGWQCQNCLQSMKRQTHE